MIQIITPTYDFRKTYYRNFYDNRKEGMIKGSKYGKFARKVHGKHIINHNPTDGTIWDSDLEEWVTDPDDQHAGCVELLPSFKANY